MTIWDHLEELRWTLIRCICAVAVCAIPAGLYWREIFHLFAVLPLQLADPSPTLIYTTPAETIITSLRIAGVCGAIIASPYIFWQLWRFIAPALYKNERIVISAIAISSTICFLTGFVFCYYLLPFVLKFLTGYGGGDIEPFFKIEDYLGFLLRMSIAFGLIFEMPVLSFGLAKFGLIDHHFLIKYFRYFVVGIFILAAIITPPDILSQIALALPMLLLYGVSIFIVWTVKAKKPSV